MQKLEKETGAADLGPRVFSYFLNVSEFCIPNGTRVSLMSWFSSEVTTVGPSVGRGEMAI